MKTDKTKPTIVNDLSSLKINQKSYEDLFPLVRNEFRIQHAKDWLKKFSFEDDFYLFHVIDKARHLGRERTLVREVRLSDIISEYTASCGFSDVTDVPMLQIYKMANEEKDSRIAELTFQNEELAKRLDDCHKLYDIKEG